MAKTQPSSPHDHQNVEDHPATDKTMLSSQDSPQARDQYRALETSYRVQPGLAEDSSQNSKLRQGPSSGSSGD